MWLGKQNISFSEVPLSESLSLSLSVSHMHTLFVSTEQYWKKGDGFLLVFDVTNAGSIDDGTYEHGVTHSLSLSLSLHLSLMRIDVTLFL